VKNTVLDELEETDRPVVSKFLEELGSSIEIER